MGKISAYKKLRLAVCGQETIQGYRTGTTLRTIGGITEMLSKIAFEYEIGSGIDGTNSIFVIDSVGLLNTTT